jgi:hypothetical protein
MASTMKNGAVLAGTTPSDQIGLLGSNNLNSTPAHIRRQVVKLAATFRLPLATAAAVASLAWEVR